MDPQQLNAAVRAIIDDAATAGQHLRNMHTMWSVMPPTWFQLDRLNAALASYLLANYDPHAYAYLFNLLEKAEKLSRQSVHLCQRYIDHLRIERDIDLIADLPVFQLLFLLTSRLRPFLRVDDELLIDLLCEKLPLARFRSLRKFISSYILIRLGNLACCRWCLIE
jgi:hypothetical protein